MTLQNQPETKFIKLDPELVSLSYKMQTNWVVIAGAPSAGKTTLIEQLANKGYNITLEPARLYLDQEFAKGRNIQDIRKDQKKLQHTFLKLQLKMESQLTTGDFIFLDRGIPDQFIYCRIAGLAPNKFVKECFHNRYKAVFILAPLPFDKDGYRDPEAEIVNYFDEWITRDYQTLGYKTIRVPLLPIHQRLMFVLDHLKQSNII